MSYSQATQQPNGYGPEESVGAQLQGEHYAAFGSTQAPNTLVQATPSQNQQDHENETQGQGQSQIDSSSPFPHPTATAGYSVSNSNGLGNGYGYEESVAVPKAPPSTAAPRASKPTSGGSSSSKKGKGKARADISSSGNGTIIPNSNPEEDGEKIISEEEDENEDEDEEHGEDGEGGEEGEGQQSPEPPATKPLIPTQDTEPEEDEDDIGNEGAKEDGGGGDKEDEVDELAEESSEKVVPVAARAQPVRGRQKRQLIDMDTEMEESIAPSRNLLKFSQKSTASRELNTQVVAATLDDRGDGEEEGDGSSDADEDEEEDEDEDDGQGNEGEGEPDESVALNPRILGNRGATGKLVASNGDHDSGSQVVAEEGKEADGNGDGNNDVDMDGGRRTDELEDTLPNSSIPRPEESPAEPAPELPARIPFPARPVSTVIPPPTAKGPSTVPAPPQQQESNGNGSVESFGSTTNAQQIKAAQKENEQLMDGITTGAGTGTVVATGAGKKKSSPRSTSRRSTSRRKRVPEEDMEVDELPPPAPEGPTEPVVVPSQRAVAALKKKEEREKKRKLAEEEDESRKKAKTGKGKGKNKAVIPEEDVQMDVDGAEEEAPAAEELDNVEPTEMEVDDPLPDVVEEEEPAAEEAAEPVVQSEEALTGRRDPSIAKTSGRVKNLPPTRVLSRSLHQTATQEIDENELEETQKDPDPASEDQQAEQEEEEGNVDAEAQEEERPASEPLEEFSLVLSPKTPAPHKVKQQYGRKGKKSPRKSAAAASAENDDEAEEAPAEAEEEEPPAEPTGEVDWDNPPGTTSSKKRAKRVVLPSEVDDDEEEDPQPLSKCARNRKVVNSGQPTADGPKAKAKAPAAAVSESDNAEQAVIPATPDAAAAGYTRVFAAWTDKHFYPATILSRRSANLYSVRFDDNAVKNIKVENLRALKLQVGDIVHHAGSIELNKKYGELKVTSLKKAKNKLALDQEDKIQVQSLVTDEEISLSTKQLRVNDAHRGQLVNRQLQDLISGRDASGLPSLLGVTPAPGPEDVVLNSDPRSSVAGSKTRRSSRAASAAQSSVVGGSTAGGSFSGLGFLVSQTNEVEGLVKELKSTILSKGGVILDDLDSIYSKPNLASGFSSISVKEQDLKGVFLIITGQPKMTTKFMQCLSLGIPCLAAKAVDQEADDAFDWKSYLVSPGKSEFLDNYTSQFVDPDWAGEDFSLEASLQSDFVKRPLHEQTVLCVSRFMNDIIPNCLCNMGASSVTLVSTLSESIDDEEYDLIIVADKFKIPGGWKQNEKVRNVEWIKQCMINGRQIPVEW